MASRSVIERRDFLPLMREEPEIALRLIEILCSRLRRTTEQAEEVMFLDLPSRLAKALMRLVDADIGDMRERKISITQKELGNIIGMSRESTNKQLRIWEDKKWVRTERNAVVILTILPRLPKGQPTAHERFQSPRIAFGKTLYRE
jgi:CRP/FNR family transcriptional regulator, cyclic AMP receptor protein